MSGLLTLNLHCVVGGAQMVLDGGHMDRGCRTLSGRVDVEGRVGQCRYARLRLDVRETYPASGEWRVSPQRVPVGGRDYHWEGLTDLARKVLTVEVSRQVQVAGFEEAWLAAFARRESYEAPELAAATCRAHARWWDEVAALTAQLRAGGLRVVPIRDNDLATRTRVDLVSTHDGRTSWDEVGARLVWPEGEQAGWLTTGGRVAPLSSPRAETHDQGLRATNGADKLSA